MSMRKTLAVFALIMILVLTVGLVSAKVGSPDEECIANGFKYGIVKYECGQYEPDELGSMGEYYNINITSWGFDDEKECVFANWEASPGVDGFVSKEGGNSFDEHFNPIKTSGTITKSDQNSISHITFCSNYEPPVVPEFGTMVGILTALGALGVFFLVRRK